MNNMKSSIEKYSTEYYDVNYSITQSEDKVWVGEALITRKDTGEEVRCGCVKYGNNKEGIEKQIYDNIKENSSFLSVPPPDWDSKVRKISAHFPDLGGRITNFGLLIDDVIEKNNKDRLSMDVFFQFCVNLRSELIELVKEIDELSANERKELLTSRDDVYNDPTEPWNLDDLTLRSEIFKYFVRPSLDEVEAHELHDNRFKQALDKIDDSEDKASQSDT